MKVHRDNYKPQENEKHLVHYKIEQVRFSEDNGKRLSHPELIKTPVKMFENIKRNLELQGFKVEIVWHPNGLYTSYVIPESNGNSEALAAKETEIKEKTDLLAEKDAEIARLMEELTRAKTIVTSAEESPKKTVEESVEETPVTKKAGRPKKEKE